MERKLYAEDHEAFRESVVAFVTRFVAPHIEKWEELRQIPRETWIEAGKQGLIGLSGPEEHGGAGQLRDFRFRQVVNEELHRAGAGSLAVTLGIQDDLLIPYFVKLGTPEQQARWLPDLCAGRSVAAIAMTEPGTGSDLRGVSTHGREVEGGWIVNGAKTFISSGISADLVVTVVKTGEGNSGRDFSLMVIENGMEGFARGRKLKKVGLHGQDTAELSFTDVFVPHENVLGGIGSGFAHLMELLPLERMSIAAGNLALMQASLEWTTRYVADRTAFGQRVMDFQNTRFRLADVATEVAATQAYVDLAILGWNDASLTAVEASQAKLYASEALGRVVDTCVQLHGGYGYMLEYPIARAYQDARIQRIYGGTSEIMREIIGRDIAGR